MRYAFLCFPGFKYKAVTLSYDDDVIFDEKLVGILDEYGLKCTFNLNSGLFAEKEGGRMMTEEQAKKLFSGSAHEVAVHGVKHLSLAEFPAAIAAQIVCAPLQWAITAKPASWAIAISVRMRSGSMGGSVSTP